jgi:hypothetical protein
MGPANEKQQAHQLLDQFDAGQLAAVVHLLQVMTGPLSRALASVPVEEEEITSETAPRSPALRWLAEKAFLTKTSCASSAWINDRTASAGTDRRHLVTRGPRRSPRHRPRHRNADSPLRGCYLANRTGDVKKLKPSFTGFRLRCGDYRAFFDQRDENTINITAVRHRGEAYR